MVRFLLYVRADAIDRLEAAPAIIAGAVALKSACRDMPGTPAEHDRVIVEELEAAAGA